MTMTGERLRAAVVGGGHMGQYHTLVFAELWDIDLVGVVDVDPQRAAAPRYAEIDALGDTLTLDECRIGRYTVP